MKKATSMEELINLVEQALFDIEELRMAAEYDYDEMGDALSFAGQLEAQTKTLLDDLKQGRHEFKNEDLPFMAIVNQQSDLTLPFKHLLRVINASHREGFGD